MISQQKYVLLVIIAVLVLLGVALWVWPEVNGLWPAIGPQAPIPSPTGSPDESSAPNLLNVPSGFDVSIFAENLPGARVLLFDSMGSLWVSQTRQDRISLLYIQDGELLGQDIIFRDLKRPHGMALDPDDPFSLYIVQEEGLFRVRIYSEGGPEKVADLPSGGRHFTRSVMFGPGDRLYVSIGSTCDTCIEANSEHGSIISMEKDGSDRRFAAQGLRNAVFIAFHPERRHQLWVTEMGRDRLGDHLPPDELNIIDVRQKAGHYGWPFCYGRNVLDVTFDRNVSCEDREPSYVDLPAHVAPLGLAFVPRGAGWPNDWEGDLIVALHGSWNSTVPVGYKLIRVRLDGRGNALGIEDFVTGFLRGNSALGRPVDVVFGPDGGLYVSDDKAGMIWRVTPPGL